MNEYAKKIQVKADLEHLQKLFIMPDSADKFLEFGHELLGLIHHFFQEKGGIHSSISLPNLAKIFSNIEIPQSPHLLKDVLNEIKTKVIAHSVKVGSPYYIGHMTSAIPYFIILLEMIIASLNQNQVKIETAKASSFVEREILAWIHNLIFNCTPEFYKRNIQDPKIALGNVTLDGTIANMTGLLVARNKAFPSSGKFPGIRKAGVHEAFRYYNCKRAVILVSKRGHYSIDKIARTIGLGDENVIKVPVDSYNKIDIHKLRKICHGISEANQNEEEKIKILCLIGIAGTTETGNVDNLVELRNIADEYGTTFHVDAAWGGSVLLVDQFRPLLKGIELADSVTFDAHKLLYSPLSMGMILFKNEKDLNNLAHTANYIIRPDSVDQGRFTIEGSRPFSCLKPWATFKILGKEGFRLLFEHAFMLTATIKKLTEEHENFEPLSIPELFIYNYRFIPNPVKECVNSLMAELKKAEHRRKTELRNKIKNVNDVLNEMNIELHRRIRMEDNSFVSRTMLESTRYAPQRIVVLRTVTINPLTTPEILKEIIDEQNRLGMQLYKSNFAKFFRDI